MKTKGFNKKLVLNKKTIANLEEKEMGSARGGQETGNPYICETHLRCETPKSDIGSPCYSDFC